MPKVRRSRIKYPADWDKVEPTLTELEDKMREAEEAPSEAKKNSESLWPIFRIHHQRSRYVYDMYYRKKDISKECYEFCLAQNYADANLIAKWKKPGFERLCCLKCIQGKETNFGGTCICRVPKRDLDSSTIVECSQCGCRGCASGD
jgi:bud site selection protein 31